MLSAKCCPICRGLRMLTYKATCSVANHYHPLISLCCVFLAAWHSFPCTLGTMSWLGRTPLSMRPRWAPTYTLARTASLWVLCSGTVSTKRYYQWSVLIPSKECFSRMISDMMNICQSHSVWGMKTNLVGFIVNPRPLRPKGYCRRPRLSVCLSLCPIKLVNKVTQSVHPINPPNLQGGFNRVLSWMVL